MDRDGIVGLGRLGLAMAMASGADVVALGTIWLDGVNIDSVSSHLCSARRSGVRRQSVDVKWKCAGYPEPELMIRLWEERVLGG